MKIKTNFDDGLMDVLKKMDAELVSIEVKGERLVKKFDRDDHTLDDIEDFFEDFDGVDVHVEYIGNERCFVCEVTTEGKDEGIVVVTAEEPKKVTMPPTFTRTNKPSRDALEERAIRGERAAQGLCVGCGKRPPDPTLVNGRPSRYCKQCQISKLSTVDKIARGIIPIPTEESPIDTISDPVMETQMKIVEAVQDKRDNDYWKNYYIERKSKLLAKGLCISCGNRKAVPLADGTPSKYCAVCRKTRRKNAKLRRIAAKKSRAKA